jgi:transcriptional regulator with XRE-family HTH domain
LVGTSIGRNPEEIVWSARLGAHVTASRHRAGLRRVDLALQLGVSEETIRLWEKGAVQPSADRLSRLIAVLALETSDWSRREDPAPDLPPLARRLREEREARAITQAEAVQLLDVPQATYAGWETGRSTPGAVFFPCIAGFLGTSPARISALCESPFVVDTSGWPALGQFLGARRQELRLTRGAIAEHLGVAQSTVVSWELGYRVPGLRQVDGLAHVLEVPAPALLAAMPDKNATTTLGDLILNRARALGLRSADVAQRAGTTEATISRWVHGRNRPASASLHRLAAALEMPFTAVAAAAGSPA